MRTASVRLVPWRTAAEVMEANLRKLTLALPLLALSAPAAAQPVDPIDAEIARAIPSPAELEALGGVLASVMDAMMDVEIGGILDAIDPYRRPEARDRTIGDLAGANDPYERERMQRSVEAATANMGDVMTDIAILAPRLRRTFENVNRDIEDATRDLPSRR